MFEDILEGWEDLMEKEGPGPFDDIIDEWDTGIDWDTGVDTKDTIWNT
jgi:hypothetical protein